MKPVQQSAAWMFTFGILAAIPGCGREADLGPPDIQYGQHECEQCRMIISEERFAAALVTHSDNRVEKLAFDDVGCLLDCLRARADREGCISYVHDHETGRWLDASRATFVKSDKLATPMASGLVAIDGEEAARRVLSRYAGVTLTFEELLR